MIWTQSDVVVDADTMLNDHDRLLEPVTPTRWRCDPLEPDAVGDEVVVTTNRRLLRLAISAADVGARLTQEGSIVDAAAWMIAPRRLFDGRSALDACQDLIGFNRSVVLHGLGLALDAEPEDIDDLLASDDASPESAGIGADGWSGDLEPRLPGACLLSCWVDCTDVRGRLFAFCAIVTDRPADLVERVVGRYGEAAAGQARYSNGFDHATPLATAMISDAMADTLALAASDPDSPLAHGLDVVVEQRFRA